MERSEIQKQCYGCGYKKEIRGDCHISCLFDWGRMSYKSGIHPPKGNAHGIMNGWYNFPYQYDPVWMIEECPAFSKEADPAKKLPDDNFSALLSVLLRKR